jgi:hypothetical protein
MTLDQQISACKRRIELVRALINDAYAYGYKPVEAELALLVEADLLEKLEDLLPIGRCPLPT